MNLLVNLWDVIVIEYNPRTEQKAWAVINEVTCDAAYGGAPKDIPRYGLVLYSPGDNGLHSLIIRRGKSSLEMMYEAHVCGEDRRKVIDWYSQTPRARARTG